MKIWERRNLLVLIGAALQVAGCASQQPMSSYARSGDTVLVSLGGTDSNALVSVLAKQNIKVSLTDAAGNVHPVKPRNIFRIYGDPTSRYAFKSVSGNFDTENFVPPHQGVWMAVIDLVDPGTGQPPSLAVGPAHLSVSSPELQPWVDYPGWGWTWSNGNLSAIPLEILSGVGAPNPLNYMQPINFSPADTLEASPQVEISVSGTPSTLVGGGSFTFRYVTQDFGVGAKRPQVTTTASDPNVQLASRYVDQADGSTMLTVFITNPHGFNVDNSKTGLLQGRSLRRSLKFSIMWQNPAKTITNANWQQSLQLWGAQYVDLDGNPLPELRPVLMPYNLQGSTGEV